MKFATITSGSSGNCIYIEGGSTRLLVDAGCTNRRLIAALDAFGTRPDQLHGLLITHEHSDHVAGVVRFARRFGIPVYASEVTWNNLPCRNDFFYDERHIFEYGLRLGEIDIDFFRLSHDASQPVGFVFAHNGKKIGVATDTGVVTPSMARQLNNIDGLIFEANHDHQMLIHGPYPTHLKRRVASEEGHLSNHQAGLALRELVGERTRAVILAHLSEINNYPDLALQQVGALLADCPAAENISLSVAPRFEPHPLIEV